MKEIVERLQENRNIEVAKSILESAGYKVSKRPRRLAEDYDIDPESIPEEDFPPISNEPPKDRDLEYVSNVGGYQVYRKIVNGKGVWFAHHQDEDESTMFPITYDQARGLEPIGPTRKLQKSLGKLLLPSDW